MLFADGDALTGGGIVGGIMGTVLAVYVIYDKIKTREKAREAEERIAEAAARAKDVVTDAAVLKNEEEEIRIGDMARKAVADAYQQALDLRARNHDADIAAVRREIVATAARVTILEDEKRECRQEVDALKRQNAQQANEIREQADEIRDLKAQIVQLEQRLRVAGALPGSGPMNPRQGSNPSPGASP